MERNECKITIISRKQQGDKKMAKKLYDEYGNEVRVAKRGGCLKWFGIGLVLFLVVSVIVSIGEDDNTPSSSQSASVASTEQPAEQEVEEEVKEESFGIGDTIQTGNLSVKVNNVSSASVIESTFSQEVPSTGNYLLVDMTVRNDGNEAVMVDSSNFKLVKGETIYNSDGTATLYANDDMGSFLVNSLNPEAVLSGTVVFDISENSAADPDLQLEISSNMFFGEKVYVNLN